MFLHLLNKKYNEQYTIAVLLPLAKGISNKIEDYGKYHNIFSPDSNTLKGKLECNLHGKIESHAFVHGKISLLFFK